MSQAVGNVVAFPKSNRLAPPDEPRATVLTRIMTAALADERPADCADALARLLAAICCVNAINVTEAIETSRAAHE
jgi:hypothetical protein